MADPNSTGKALTAVSVKNLKPQDKVYEYMDSGAPGFGVRVHPSGSKAFIYRYRRLGQLRRLTIGPIPGKSLKDARKDYETARAKLQDGIDPLREQEERERAEQQAVSFEALARIYLERHASRKRTGDRDLERLERDVLPRWKKWKARDIRKRDVLDMLQPILDRGAPIQANRVFETVRRLFNFAVQQDLLNTTPCTGIKKPSPENTRDRVLSDDELLLFWNLNLPGRIRALLRLQLLLSQRVGEVAGMRWSEIDENTRSWTLPAERVKNATVHVVPLPDMAMDILREQHLLREEGNDYVFPAAPGGHVRVDTVVTGLRRALDLAAKDAPVERFGSHDLRRTAATRISGMQVSGEILRQILNHKDTSVTGRYDRYRYGPEKRAALEAWERELRRILEQREPNPDVVTLLRRG